MTLSALREVEDHGFDPLVYRGLPREPELEEDRVDHLLDRPLGQEQRRGNRGVVLSFGHLAQDVVFTRCQLTERRLLAASVLRDERLHDLRVHDGAALCNGADSRDELLDVVHALLQQVCAPLAAPFQERENEARRRVLAEHDDADVRVRLAEPQGGLDALVAIAGRHANVRDDDVGALSVDRGEQGVEVVAHGRDLELLLRLEQTPNALADEVLIFGEHEPDRHPGEDTAKTSASPATESDQPLVLIVDDSEKNRKLARDVLRVGGFQTAEAASGAEAISVAGEHIPDVILMDLRLPDMDGIDVLRTLGERARTSGIPVVALSSSLLEGGGDWLRAAGFAGYIEKPISVRDFAGQVRRYCGRTKA